MSGAIIRFRVDLGPELGVGPGKIALLEQIGARGSLSEAARTLGMSYRRAWQLLDSLNRCLKEPVTRAQKGGQHGGGSSLTDFGRQLIRVYRAFDAETQRRGTRAFRAIGAKARTTHRAAPAGAAGLRMSER
jgi:molybdate transport system regulatory protein